MVGSSSNRGILLAGPCAAKRRAVDKIPRRSHRGAGDLKAIQPPRDLGERNDGHPCSAARPASPDSAPELAAVLLVVDHRPAAPAPALA